MGKKVFLRKTSGIIALILFIVVMVLLVREHIGLDSIRNIVEIYGAAGWIAFITLYIVATLAVVPGTLMTAAGGILFGTLYGTIINVIGASIGATVTFLISRKLGRKTIEGIEKKRVKKLEERVKNKGFEAVLILRLIPLVPFNILNYGLGLTSIKTWQYIVATIIGIIPATFIYTYAASLAGEVLLQEGITALTTEQMKEMIIPAVLLIILALMSLLTRKIRNKKID